MQDCKFVQVKNNKRKTETKSSSDTKKNKENNEEKRKKDTPDSTKKDAEKHFLGVVQVLKKELMEAMDTKIAKLLSMMSVNQVPAQKAVPLHQTHPWMHPWMMNPAV